MRMGHVAQRCLHLMIFSLGIQNLRPPGGQTPSPRPPAEGGTWNNINIYIQGNQPTLLSKATYNKYIYRRNNNISLSVRLGYSQNQVESTNYHQVNPFPVDNKESQDNHTTISKCQGVQNTIRGAHPSPRWFPTLSSWTAGGSREPLLIARLAKLLVAARMAVRFFLISLLIFVSKCTRLMHFKLNGKLFLLKGDIL